MNGEPQGQPLKFSNSKNPPPIPALWLLDGDHIQNAPLLVQDQGLEGLHTPACRYDYLD